MLVTGWHSNIIKENTIIFQAEEEPTIGVVFGDDLAAEHHSRGEHLSKKDGIYRVFEALPLGRAVSVPVESWSDNIPLVVS